MLKAKSDDPETVNLIEGAAAGMVATVEKMGPDALEDWEVDELLEWTNGLNFDQYVKNNFFTVIFGLFGGYGNFSKTLSNTNIC